MHKQPGREFLAECHNYRRKLLQSQAKGYVVTHSICLKYETNDTDYRKYLNVIARSPSAPSSSGVYPLCAPSATCRSLFALMRL